MWRAATPKTGDAENAHTFDRALLWNSSFLLHCFYSFKGKHLEIFKSHKRPRVNGISFEVINPLFQQVFKLANDGLVPTSYLSEPCCGYNVVRASHSPALLGGAVDCRQFDRIYQKP